MKLKKDMLLLWWLPITTFAGIALTGWSYKSYFEIQLAANGIAFVTLQLWLINLAKKEESIQEKKLKASEFLTLLPAIGTLASGIRTIVIPYAGLPQKASYAVTALCATLVLFYIFQLISIRKNHLLSIRFLRLVTEAAISIPASLLVASLLYITESEGMANLSSMTTIVFALKAALVALNLILVSFLGYRSTADSIREIRNLIKSKKLIFIRVSIIKDAILVIGKGIISIISLSFFMFVNTLYSAGMGGARFIALRMHGQKRKKQQESYQLVGIIITGASVCYIIYSVRLFYGGKSSNYPMNIALVIALYTFVEFGINIREAFRLRKSHKLEAKALRAISFASTLLCFVLTQTAIMSFANEGSNRTANALSGVFFGGMSAIIGLYVILDSFHHKTRNI